VPETEHFPGEFKSKTLTSAARSSPRLFRPESSTPLPQRIQILSDHVPATHPSDNYKQIWKNRKRNKTLCLSLCREKARRKLTYEERERENVAEKTLRIYTIPQALSSQSTTTTSISDSNSRKIAGNARQCWIISPELLVNGEQLLLLQLLSLTFSLLILRWMLLHLRVWLPQGVVWSEN